MSTDSKIEWTDATWNPVVGCTPVSPGCLNCYAATMARRLEGMGRLEYAPREWWDPPSSNPDGSDAKPARLSHVTRIAEVRNGRAVFTGDVRTVPERLGEPLRWRKPRRVFVNSMSDLFHEAVPDQFIRLVFAAMSWAGQHTYQVLTKRPERMAAWFADPDNDLSACQAEWTVNGPSDQTPTGKHRIGRRGSTGSINGTRRGVGDGNYWPLPNVWLGTSVENQACADWRIPHLLKCPAAVRFLSCEPLLGPLDLSAFFGGPYVGLPGERVHENYNFGIGWVIVGGESGPKSRPCRVEWIRSIVRQCKAAGVPCFVKQLGAHVMCRNDRVSDWMDQPGGPSLCDIDTDGVRFQGDPVRVWMRNRKGGDPSEWPEDLRVRELPDFAEVRP